jgi:hypothetical protein
MTQEKSYYERLYSLIRTMRRIAADQVKDARKYAAQGDTKTNMYFILEARKTRCEVKSWIAYARRFKPVADNTEDQRIAA